MDTINLPDDKPKPQPESPARVPLARLTHRPGSLALTRIVSNGTDRRGPGRVVVAAFQSSV